MAKKILAFMFLSIFTCSAFCEDTINIVESNLKTTIDSLLSVTNPETLKTQSGTPEIEWERTLGSNFNCHVYSVQQDKNFPSHLDPGFYATGYTHSSRAGDEDVYLSRYDLDGNKQWESHFGGSGDDRGYWILQSYNYCFMVVGSTNSYGNGGYDLYFLRVDSEGNKIDERTIGGSGNEVGYCIEKVSDQESIIAGSTDSYGKGGTDVYLVKAFESGSKIWDKTFGGSKDDCGYSVQKTTDEGFIIAGYTYSYGAEGADVYLIKTGSNGEMQWEKTYGGTGDDYGFCVQQTSDGGYIISGSTNSYGAGGYDVYLIKTDSEGHKQWEKTFGGSKNDTGCSVAQSFHGGYMISGNTQSYGSGLSDIYMIRTDAEGNVLWENTIGGNGNDFCSSALQTSDAGYIIAGYTDSNETGTTDGCLIKLRSDTTPLKIIYVDDDANGINDGSSWQNAYTYLQDALVDANLSNEMCEIRIAGGKYKPDHGENVILGDKKAIFKLDNDVIIKGGYAGIQAIGITEDPNSRDTELYDTLISGDLNDDDVDVTDVKSLLEYNLRPDNSYKIFTMVNDDCVVVLDGLHIVGACESGFGGAIVIGVRESNNCYFEINNCTFEENSSGFGGAIYNENRSNIIIKNCKFIHNASGDGGAVCARCKIGLFNCIFRENYSSNFGGAVYNTSYNSSIVDCIFENNSSFQSGAIAVDGDISISNCTFIGNSAGKGGAFGGCERSGYGKQQITGCTFRDNIATTYGGGIYGVNKNLFIRNSLFIGNTCSFWGGAISLYGGTGEISNCTIINNLAERGGLLCCVYEIKNIQSSVNISNCILRNNSEQIYNYNDSQISIGYNCVNNLDPNGIIVMMGNIDEDPLFTDPNNFDYHLKSQTGRWDPNIFSWVHDDVTSPCIDAGDPNSDWGEELWPHGKRINMGAYGGTSQASMSLSDVGDIRDLNNDDSVTWDDVLLLTDKWDSNSVPLKQDLNLDGIVDVNDLAFFYGNWSLNSDDVPPVFDPINDRHITVGEALIFPVSAVDSDSDELIYTVPGLPDGAQFSKQIFSWTPQRPGIYTATFIVSDYESLDYVTIKIVVDEE